MVLTRRQPTSQDAAGDKGDIVMPDAVASNSSAMATKTNDIENRKTTRAKEATPSWVIVILITFAAITVFTVPHPFHPVGEPQLQHVFYYGWLTAVSTGAGVLPFVFLPDGVPSFWIGVSNGMFVLDANQFDGGALLTLLTF